MSAARTLEDQIQERSNDYLVSIDPISFGLLRALSITTGVSTRRLIKEAVERLDAAHERAWEPIDPPLPPVEACEPPKRMRVEGWIVLALVIGVAIPIALLLR